MTTSSQDYHATLIPCLSDFAHRQTRRVLYGSTFLATLVGCLFDEGGSPLTTSGSDTSSGLSAPIVSEPLPGATLSSNLPTLTVLNSGREDLSPPSYLFQLADDLSFGSLVAQSTLILEDSDGTTSWEVDHALTDGRYFWRARARAGTVESEFSDTAELNILLTDSDTPPAPTPRGALISDPLIGGSVGEVQGGVFTSSGWQVTAKTDFIRYDIPPASSGFVEFDTSGLRPENPANDQFMLFGMWDPSRGPFRENPFRVNIQKLHPNPHNPPYLRLRWITQGEQHDEGSSFFNWDPERTYHWRLAWGTSGSGNRAELFLDGELLIAVKYNRSYQPVAHFVELGIAERRESVVGVTYSNLVIGN